MERWKRRKSFKTSEKEDNAMKREKKQSIKRREKEKIKRKTEKEQNIEIDQTRK